MREFVWKVVYTLSVYMNIACAKYANFYDISHDSMAAISFQFSVQYTQEVQHLSLKFT